MRQRPLALACIALVSAAACGTEDEHAILIEADSTVVIETVDVTVVDLEGRRPPTLAAGRDVRPPADGTADGVTPPLRIVVRLSRPGFVLVHLVGHAGAERFIATRCYRVDGILRDRLVLAGPLEDDADGDSFPATAGAWCLDPPAENPVPCDFACGDTGASDCNDADPAINPAAAEICENGSDENCDGGDAPCADGDGDGFTACRPETPPGVVCDCDDTRATVYPGAPDACANGVDEDCRDGDAMCDGDGDGYPADRPTGGSPDCDDGNAEIHPGAAENPGGVCDGIDNNCNGLVDEIEACTPSDLDRDGAMDCGGGTCRADCDCNDCDPGIRPGAPESCRNGIDANGDGTRPTCPSGDLDRDGFASTSAGGADCNDGDATVYPGAPDYCGDGVAQGCVADHPCGTDADGDHFSAGDDCDDSDASRNPYATFQGGSETPERCDGVDDDCDGVVDEVLDPSGALGCIFDTRRTTGCTGGFCTIDFRSDLQHCGRCRFACDLDTADACIGGTCSCTAAGSECSGGTSCCSDGCQDLDNDRANCGGCGRRCDLPTMDGCSGGECSCGSGPPCGAGQICCDGTCYPDDDPHHCGVCGNDCVQGGRSTVCIAGRCSCGGGGAGCLGSTVSQCCGVGATAACTDLSRDPANCGACGTTVDINGDPRNCGGCLQACNPDRANACAGGSCTCMVSGRPCGGDASDRCCPAVGCVDLRNDVDNCGECGRRCAANQRCDVGRCVCVTNYQDCDGAAGCESDRRNDTNNCGGCGTVCRAPTPSCVNGACRACASAADCTDDGLACTGSPRCEDSACVHPLLPGNCIISGACVSAMATNGTNVCEWCDPATSTSAWTARPGLACDDRLYCTISDACNAAGVCTGGGPRDCSDGLACTTDSCVEATDSCAASINAGFCVIAGACVASGGRDPGNQCRECNPANNPGDWSNRTGACDDGLYCTNPDACSSGTCTGPARDCRDSRGCTADMCDEAADMCRNPINPGRCLIGTSCYNTGDDNPANQCQECVPTTSATTWTNRTGACDDGMWCTENDACSAGSCGGTLRSCEEVPANMCTTDMCNEAMDMCVHAPSGTGCMIDGMCLTPGTQNPLNQCQTCNPAMNPTGWSNRTGSCDDGMFCTINDACSAGTCTGGGPNLCHETPTDDPCTTDTCSGTMCMHSASGCTIAGTCYASGAPNPANSCQECNPAMSTSAWSPVMNGTSCSDGLACTSGETCTSGTCMGGTSNCGATRMCNMTSGACECVAGRANCDTSDPDCECMGSCAGAMCAVPDSGPADSGPPPDSGPTDGG